MRRVQEDIPLVIGTDYSSVERRVLDYMHATFVHESAGGSPTPRGKIDLFEYDDHFRINLEGSGEIDGTFMRGAMPFDRLLQPKKPAKKQNGRSAAYLDHDPTKRHKRRKKK